MAFGGENRWQGSPPLSSSIGIQPPIPRRQAVEAWELWEKITGHLHTINPAVHRLLQSYKAAAAQNTCSNVNLGLQVER